MTNLILPEDIKPDRPEDIYLGEGRFIVKFFKNDFGILYGSDNLEYFIHYSDIYKSAGGYKALAKGQSVTGYKFKGPKGLYAKQVRVISA